MTATKKSEITRRRILDTGRELVLKRGFGGVGLKALLETSGVPKGSFYYYFDSKEAFGCALLRDYVDGYLERVDAIFAGPGSAGERLMAFWSAWLGGDAAGSIADRCLVVKLASEVSDLSEEMRRILDGGVDELAGRIATLLREGAADGSLRPRDDPETAARLLYAQWLGAAILAKLSKDRAPLAASLEDTRRRLVA
ncbi:TetR/AcrR family transcriptional regulator [Oricola thermophila]|uniref:TetR/AcrR family transcriptional regulator n=1 Tax=Oricola thermophila TaxID=2742145 RepID=A0A6N1VL18_9HYPH|nr:TetR/AcrR family transcriptional regulator [Oricola thermophila]QKV19909.1 TetR/AcrR family transcriptional regulator [Oricola thermophila]